MKISEGNIINLQDMVSALNHCTVHLHDAYKRIKNMMYKIYAYFALYLFATIWGVFTMTTKEQVHFVLAFQVFSTFVFYLIVKIMRKKRNDFMKEMKEGFVIWEKVTDIIDWGVKRRNYTYKGIDSNTKQAVNCFYELIQSKYSPVRTYFNHYQLLNFSAQVFISITMLYIAYLMFVKFDILFVFSD